MNASNVRVDLVEERWGQAAAEVRFLAAWSPPFPVVARAAELFPDLDFDLRYFHTDMAVHGAYHRRGDAVVRDESGPYYGRRGE
jgi:hypothetical protein